MASIQSPEDIVNATLKLIGRTERVSTLYDGSAAAKIALDFYGQTRDALLRQSDWGFPRRDANLTLLKSAPPGGYNPVNPWVPGQQPPPPYSFEYAYPDDCLMVRALRRPILFTPVFTPRPVVFEIANDLVAAPLLDDNGNPLYADDGTPLVGDSTPARVILCYIPNAILTYCGGVTDPTTWDVGFTDAMIETMARKMAPAFARIGQGEAEAEKLEMAVAPSTAAMAVRRVG
jgi:hypothetical protein